MNIFCTKAYKFLILLSALFVLSGCARLKWLDQKVGEMFFGTATSNETIVEEDVSDGPDMALDAASLTLEQKEKIDQWLADNNLNRYGDALGTFYTGGTPLFNEMTGESKERFEYILEKMPDMMEKIGGGR